MNPLSHSLIFHLDVDTGDIGVPSLGFIRLDSPSWRIAMQRSFLVAFCSRRLRMLTESSARIPDNGEFISCFTPPRSPAILYRPLHPTSSYPSSCLRVCFRNIYNRDKRLHHERGKRLDTPRCKFSLHDEFEAEFRNIRDKKIYRPHLPYFHFLLFARMRFVELNRFANEVSKNDCDE